ncbi:MAG: HAD family phosphatase [Candidatus Delongbacteria bacterium]|nr:HAD family phosphatase [Candidatus Delongbacteria bacterium]MBN2837012.1 HAD family phosphatase [Candidatus Delongbacteria bacterium]
MKTNIFVTDIDGTLFDENGKINDLALLALEKLQGKAIRVLATGRSLPSLRTFIKENFPADYLVLSCGVGIVRNSSNQILKTNFLDYKKVLEISDFLKNEGLSFSIQFPLPENHKMYFWKGRIHPEDFLFRINKYDGEAFDLKMFEIKNMEYSQIISVVDDVKEAIKLINLLKEKFRDINIIRSTSPVNHQSVWVEIQNKDASKSSGLKQLLEILEIENPNICGIGNDYNDLDFLEICKQAYIVDNSPEELKNKFQTVPSVKMGGVYHACKNSGFCEDL